MLPCRCTLLPPAARRPFTGVIVTVRQARRWSATLLDRRTGLRQALHFWIGVYKRQDLVPLKGAPATSTRASKPVYVGCSGPPDLSTDGTSTNLLRTHRPRD